MTAARVRRISPRGVSSLPAALAALAVSVSFTAALADLTRTEVILARFRRAATAALAAADGCLAGLVAATPPGWDFDAALAGPDGVAATPDDGTLVAPAGCSATARRPPGAATPARLLVTVDAAAAGGRRRLEAIVGRSRAPGVPALLWLGGAPAAGTIAGTLDVDGTDAADATAAALAALAAPADPVSLDAWLAGEGSHVATHGTAPPLTAPSAPLAALLGRLVAAGAGDVGALPPAGTRHPERLGLYWPRGGGGGCARPGRRKPGGRRRALDWMDGRLRGPRAHGRRHAPPPSVPGRPGRRRPAAPLAAAPRPARCQGSGIAGPAESMPKRILVVEDDPDHRRIVTKVLAREGYDVIEAATGAAAVAAAREDRPDLIIMDLALPGLDGFEASRRIKAAPDSADIPIVALTAFAMRGDEERARAAGCDAYVPKPCRPQTLREVVRQFLPEP